MMKAWYIATALAKQYEAVLPILQERLMDSWSHNKAIQKARESYRITSQQKEYLSTLKAVSYTHLVDLACFYVKKPVNIINRVNRIANIDCGEELQPS